MHVSSLVLVKSRFLHDERAWVRGPPVVSVARCEALSPITFQTINCYRNDPAPRGGRCGRLPNERTNERTSGQALAPWPVSGPTLHRRTCSNSFGLRQRLRAIDRSIDRSSCRPACRGGGGSAGVAPGNCLDSAILFPTAYGSSESNQDHGDTDSWVRAGAWNRPRFARSLVARREERRPSQKRPHGTLQCVCRRGVRSCCTLATQTAKQEHTRCSTPHPRRSKYAANKTN
jgi:hypothetical protein